MFARQSEELAGFCRTAGDTVYVSAFIERLLLMADNLEYGIKGVQKTDFLRKYSDESSLLYAFYDELKKNLKILNVTPVEADGMYFDPYVHDAMLAEQIEIYRVGMVEIVVALFLVGAVAEILVVCILRNYHDIFLQLLSDGPDYCSLSGTGSAGYSYYHHILLV